MKKRFAVMALALWLLAQFSGCGPQSAGTTVEKPALVINKLKLTTEEIRQDRLFTAWTHDTEAVEGDEPEWLGRLIERELLVQEAQRLGLDRRPDFMRTIERFWKEALIKILLIQKGQEIGDRTRVYEPEIEAYYKKLAEERQKEGRPVEALPELREEIRREIREGKENEVMDQWIYELREKAQVTIDREAVSGIG